MRKSQADSAADNDAEAPVFYDMSSKDCKGDCEGVFAFAMPDERWHSHAKTLAHYAAHMAGALALPTCEISVLLGDDAALLALNQRYRGKAATTNVLAFATHDSAGDFALPRSPILPEPDMAQDAPPLLLGDIALSYERVAAEAQTSGRLFIHRAAHLLTHGVLHLLGHRHDDEAGAQIMEALEIKVLAGYGIANPYIESAPS